MASLSMAPAATGALWFAVYHGPDRIQVRPTRASFPPAENEPFHGIMPRGLTVDGASAEDWRRYAHRLFDGPDEGEPELIALRQAVRRHRVLSFRHSAEAARRYVEAHCVPRRAGICELWNLKEGHTSSIWRVALRDEAGYEEFVLNVARDQAAGGELARTSQTMWTIGERHPELGMAVVEDLAEVDIDYFGEALAVTVARNELVPDALEIHLGQHRRTGEPTYVVVERFLTDPEHPAEIAHLVGRKMTDAECLRLEADLAAFLAAGCEHGPVAVDINEGDLVWDGTRAVVVAIR